MKTKLLRKISLILVLVTVFSCESDYKVLNTIIVKGKISDKETGHKGRFSTLPIIYIQDSKNTKKISIPFVNENDFKIADSITLVIQQVECINKK
jgi:hypothetical protein